MTEFEIRGEKNNCDKCVKTQKFRFLNQVLEFRLIARLSIYLNFFGQDLTVRLFGNINLKMLNHSIWFRHWFINIFKLVTRYRIRYMILYTISHNAYRRLYLRVSYNFDVRDLKNRVISLVNTHWLLCNDQSKHILDVSLTSKFCGTRRYNLRYFENFFISTYF